MWVSNIIYRYCTHLTSTKPSLPMSLPHVEMMFSCCAHLFLYSSKNFTWKSNLRWSRVTDIVHDRQSHSCHQSRFVWTDIVTIPFSPGFKLSLTHALVQYASGHHHLFRLSQPSRIAIRLLSILDSVDILPIHSFCFVLALWGVMQLGPFVQDLLSLLLQVILLIRICILRYTV